MYLDRPTDREFRYRCPGTSIPPPGPEISGPGAVAPIWLPAPAAPGVGRGPNGHWLPGRRRVVKYTDTDTAPNTLIRGAKNDILADTVWRFRNLSGNHGLSH